VESWLNPTAECTNLDIRQEREMLTRLCGSLSSGRRSWPALRDAFRRIMIALFSSPRLVSRQQEPRKSGLERIEGAFARGRAAKKKEEGTEIVRGVVCLCFRLHGFGCAIESSRTEPRAVV